MRRARGTTAWALRTLSAAVLAVTVAGCLDSTVPSAGPTATRAPDPTPQVTVYDIGATVWYEGLVVRVDTATATLDQRGGPVTLTIRIENPTGDIGELNGPIRLILGSTHVDPNRDSTVPVIPPNGSMPVHLNYDLQGISSIDLASIEIGSAPDHIARVPLTPAAGAPVVFEPLPLDLSGSATAADLKITLRQGLLRWDLPDYSQELGADLQALTLSYDVTYIGSLSYGLPFTFDNVALRLPGGKVVGQRPDGHSQSLELIGPRKTKKDLFSRFEIPSGATGKFALLVRNGGIEKAISFTIGG